MDKYSTKQESKTPNSKKRYKKPEDNPLPNSSLVYLRKLFIVTK